MSFKLWSANDDALVERTRKIQSPDNVGLERKGFISDEAFLIKGKFCRTAKIVDEMRYCGKVENPAPVMYTPTMATQKDPQIMRF